MLLMLAFFRNVLSVVVIKYLLTDGGNLNGENYNYEYERVRTQGKGRKKQF